MINFKNEMLLKTLKQEKTLEKLNTYEKLSKKEVEDFLAWGDTNEFSWGYCIYLLNELQKEKEEYITLEKDYGTCELENGKLRSKIIELKDRIDKAIKKLENMKNIKGGMNSTILQAINDVDNTINILKREE